MGVAVPSFILVTLTCYFINKFKESNVIKGAFVGIRPVTVGLIAAAVIYMGQSVFVDISLIPVLILAATLVLICKFKVSPITIVIGAGVIGALLCG